MEEKKVVVVFVVSVVAVVVSRSIKMLRDRLFLCVQVDSLISNDIGGGSGWRWSMMLFDDF